MVKAEAPRNLSATVGRRADTHTPERRDPVVPTVPVEIVLLTRHHYALAAIVREIANFPLLARANADRRDLIVPALALEIADVVAAPGLEVAVVPTNLKMVRNDRQVVMLRARDPKRPEFGTITIAFAKLYSRSGGFWNIQKIRK